MAIKFLAGIIKRKNQPAPIFFGWLRRSLPVAAKAGPSEDGDCDGGPVVIREGCRGRNSSEELMVRST